MTDRKKIQTPMDLSEWQPVDLTEQTPREGGIPDTEQLRTWAAEDLRNPTPISPDDELKAELLRQHHADHFEVPDPSDGLTDDELFERMPKPWRNA
jgi:hypothetical protein